MLVVVACVQWNKKERKMVPEGCNCIKKEGHRSLHEFDGEGGGCNRARIPWGLRIPARLGLSFSNDIETTIHKHASSLLDLSHNLQSVFFTKILVATDDERIADCCHGFGADVITILSKCGVVKVLQATPDAVFSTTITSLKADACDQNRVKCQGRSMHSSKSIMFRKMKVFTKYLVHQFEDK
ncbi:unnamed protein product [Lactuca saligna]|uniref:Uncharacterized protein n=1 Tax=Lactuca saligna TaxID=75948 RepID=A0AA35YZ24_LACSI|nr:unnamed protein product [Lactuca saligna]